MEGKGPVELLLVDPVASLDLAVVPRGPRPDPLVVGAEAGKAEAEGGRLAGIARGLPAEFRPVVRLDDLRRIPEEGDRAREGGDRIAHGMLVAEIEEPLAARLVDDRVLVVALVGRERRRLALGRDELDVHLPFLARVFGRVVLPRGPRLGVGL